MEAQREKNLSSHKGVLPEVAEVVFKPRLSAPEHGIESLSYIIKKKNSQEYGKYQNDTCEISGSGNSDLMLHGA